MENSKKRKIERDKEYRERYEKVAEESNVRINSNGPSPVYDFSEIVKEFGFVFSTNRVPVSEPTPYHSHNFVELAFIEQGSGYHKIGDQVMRCSKGDMYLIESHVNHQYKPDTPGDLVVANCLFLPEFFDMALSGSMSLKGLSGVFLFRSFLVSEHLPFIKTSFTGQDFEFIFDTFAKIRSEYERRDPGFIELIRAYMIELLVFILRSELKSGKNVRTTGTSNEFGSVAVNRVISYIQHNYATDIRIQDLADVAFMSVSQLRRIFDRITGIGLKEFISNVRIAVACRLLADTELSIAEVGAESGFRDYNYFCKFFLKEKGCTPSAFRRSKLIHPGR